METFLVFLSFAAVDLFTDVFDVLKIIAFSVSKAGKHERFNLVMGQTSM